MTTASPERVRPAVRLTAVADVPRPSGGSGARVHASWDRCRARGQAVDVLLAPPVRPVDTDSVLRRAADPVLASLEATLAREPVGVLLTDAAGVVVDRRGRDHGVLAALDAVCLVRGADAGEGAVGTSGVGLALADGLPALVVGEQHYLLHFGGFTCAGAPVRDLRTDAVVGAVGLATPSSRGRELLLALAGQTALAVEARLALGTSRRLPPAPGHGVPRTPARPHAPRLSRFEELERDAVAAALTRQGGDVGAAAGDLGLSRATVYRKIKRYGLRT